MELNNPIKGEMNGYKFSVKPKSLLARKVDKELKEEMREWQETNNKEYIDWQKKHSEEIERALEAKDYGADVFLNAPESKEWLDDADFRSKRFKKMADACMVFEKTPKKELWESDEIEYGMIEIAWDFFTGKRQMPMNMLLG